MASSPRESIASSEGSLLFPRASNDDDSSSSDTSSHEHTNSSDDASEEGHSNDDGRSIFSEDSSVMSRKEVGRPRFNSGASWADSTRFDRADSRASELSARDLRLSGIDTASRRSRTDSRASRYSRRSSFSSSTASSQNFNPRSGSSRKKKKSTTLSSTSGPRGLSSITEGWDAPLDQFASPFADIDAQEQPIRDQLEKGLTLVNEHATKLKDVEDAVSGSISEVWGYWADPIQLHTQPAEKVDVQDLIRTDNELFNKVLTVFAVLCDEISELKVTAEANFYPALIMFGQAKHGDESEIQPGEDEQHMGRMLPFFQDVSNFIDRCNSIATNLIHQLASLYQNFQKVWKSTFKLVHLQPAFDALADLLEVMITIDAIVMDNSNIVTAWDKFKRMMQYVRADPERYSMTVERVKQFERLLVSLDQTIMGAQVLQTCIEQDFEALPYLNDDEDEDEDEQGDGLTIDVRHNKVFLDEMFHCIKSRFDQCESIIGTSSETYERSQVIGTFGLYILFRRLTPPNVLPDGAFYKRLWALQSKAPTITMCGKILFRPPEFLLQYAPFAMKKVMEPSDVMQCRREFLHHFDERFPVEIARASKELQVWLVRMETFMQPTTRDVGDTDRIISIRGNLMLKGLTLALRVQERMHSMLNLHLNLNIPMQKKVVRALAQSIEVLKSIQFMFARKNVVIAESSGLMMAQLGQSLLNLLRPMKAGLESSQRFDDTKLDILASLSVMEDILRTNDSFSYTRLTVLALSVEIGFIQSSSSSSSTSESGAGAGTSLSSSSAVKKILRKLSLLSDFQRKVRHATDCSFFYWSRELLLTFLSDLYSCPEHASRVQYVLSGFSDATKTLHGAQHLEPGQAQEYVDAYAQFISDCVEEEVLRPLCQDIENDLRLHIHSVHFEHMELPNPKDSNAKALHYYLDLRPVRVMGHFINIRAHVTDYLERTFYNLTIVALHDWKTYAEMRNLANDKYGLEMSENHLPMGSLDQGLDILQIMRNIHIFVARYNYNCNQQFFLERRSDSGSRHLNSINIHSIASSIRTHGMGIMNTTVNVTYQFLTKKFDVFSQFLFDEYIKSYLQIEQRWYTRERDTPEVDNKYSYGRAFQFNKDIRKLGVSSEGKTFLDQFRLLITEIGNAMGYVRMVRSAGMNYCSNAIKFVPDLNTNQFCFEPHVGTGTPVSEEEEGETKEAGPEDEAGSRDKVIHGAHLSSDTIAAARNLDAVISNLSKNFSENNDYFKILVKVFQEVMVNETKEKEQRHLANFYQIIPALTINFVETSVQAKDLMYKNSRRKESYFSDDGFAIGLAYILAILNQGEKLDALHWFDEVAQKYALDEQKFQEKHQEREARKKEQASRRLKETTAELIDDEEEVHTLQLTAKRIEQHRREFDLLNWSLNGARIFFKHE